MPFLAKEHPHIPTQDIISWHFDAHNRYDPDKPVYIDALNPSRSLSWRQGRTIVRKLAAGFRKHGLKKGECVIVSAFNDLYYPMLALGIIAAGGVFTGMNPSYTPFEISHHVNTVHGKFVVTEPDMLKNVLDAKHDIPKERVFIFDNHGEDIPKGFKSYKSLMDHGEADWPRFNDHRTASSTTAMLLFSSGTTGLPKAVQLSHHNLISQHTLVYELNPRPYTPSRLIPLPMFHAAATPVAVVTPFRSGDLTYIMRRFDFEPFLDYHQRYKITETIVVPPIAIAIIMSPITKNYSLKSVRWVLCGAAPLDKDSQARLQSLLADDAPFTQVWGMTETSCVASMIPPPEQDTTGSVGRMLPTLDVKLVDDDGNDISAPNVRGEICVRGPLITRGYFENPEANARDWDKDGYFHTGDIGFVNEKSMWYIVDRKKELIKVRGFQVAPPEVEAVLLSHPSIIDAAVIGIPAPAPSRDGEWPRAYVVQRPGTSPLSEQEVVEFVGQKLAKYKRLDGGVKFMEAIPKTASGKILKRELREIAKKEVGSQHSKPKSLL